MVVSADHHKTSYCKEIRVDNNIGRFLRMLKLLKKQQARTGI